MAPKLKNNTELSAAEWAKPQTFTKILKTYFPNISNSELLELTLRKRVHDIRMRCKEYMGVTRKWRGRRPEIIMVSSATIEYCCTAKTGTQFWKTLIPKVRERLRDFSTPDSGGKIVSMLVNKSYCWKWTLFRLECRNGTDKLGCENISVSVINTIHKNVQFTPRSTKRRDWIFSPV